MGGISRPGNVGDTGGVDASETFFCAASVWLADMPPCPDDTMGAVATGVSVDAVVACGAVPLTGGFMPTDGIAGIASGWATGGALAIVSGGRLT